jgi:hypothetical protein
MPKSDRLLVTNLSASTIPETGLASHWAAATNRYSYPARYSAVLIPGENEGALSPSGAGMLTVTVNADGLATIVGETALGQKFTQSDYLSDRHSVPVYYYDQADTLVVGELVIEQMDGVGPRLFGGWTWFKEPNGKSKTYPYGFSQDLMVVGAPLPAIGKGLPALAPLGNPQNRANLLLEDGGPSRVIKPIAQVLTPTAAGFTVPKAGTAANPNRVTLKFDTKTGFITGSASVIEVGKKKSVRPLNFRGILVKNPLGDGEDLVGGYCLVLDNNGQTQSVRFEITEPSSTTKTSSSQ